MATVVREELKFRCALCHEILDSEETVDHAPNMTEQDKGRLCEPCYVLMVCTLGARARRGDEEAKQMLRSLNETL